MTEEINVSKQNLTKWVSLNEVKRLENIMDRCKLEFVKQALSHMEGIKIISVTVNKTGEYQPPTPPYAAEAGLPDPFPETGLPDYCDVRVHHQTPGGHIEHITVWIPLNWNRRFLGLTGGGNRTDSSWMQMEQMRLATLPIAIRNGFSVATTDAGNRNKRHSAWGLNPETKELDWELIRNWVYRSTHSMTVVGKTVTEAIHGAAPTYSYLHGSSGGGRQALVEAQRYPNDYDGIWSDSPAINWTKFIPAEIWPVLVMKEYKNPIPTAKFEAFRTAVIDKYDGKEGFVASIERPEFNAQELIGKRTGAGEITELDATVMQKIWEGPRTSDGKFLWYGLRPGTESWGNNVLQSGLCMVQEIDGEVTPEPFSIASDYIGAWLLRDPNWDWTTLTFSQFEQLFELSVREFEEIASDNPDLIAFRDSGAKLLLSHGLNDELIFPEGTIDYYNRVIDVTGSEVDTTQFLRLFLSPGDGHGHITAAGPGLSLSSGMIALMDWVENGNAPKSIMGEKFDLSNEKITMTKPIHAYHLKRKSSSVE